MMNTHGDRSAGEDNSNLSSISSFTHTSPTSKEESSLRETTDARLVQALNYVNDEGGDDSPATYINRVKRIDHELVQRLFFERGDYDETLHQQLRAVVRKELGAFSHAVYNDPPGSDGLVSESEHEASPAFATFALYRREEEVTGPGSSSPAKGEIDYENLTLNDIRARLQLPMLPEEVEKEIKQWCTAEQIEKVVEEFKRSDEGEDLSKDHTLGAFLDKLMLGKQGDLTDIRHAVNASPTKLQASSAQSSSQSAASKKHIAREQALKAALDTTTGSKVGLGKPTHNFIAPSPVARKIDRSRAISLKNSPRRQSGVSTEPPSAEITPTEAATPQQGPDGKRVFNTSAKNMSQSANISADVDTPKPSSSKKARRKRSVGQRAYTPEKKRKKNTVPSSLKKSGGASLPTPERSVRFMAEDSDDVSSDSSIAIRGSKPKKVASRRTPKSKIKLAKTSVNSESKASPSKRIAASRKPILPPRNTPAKPAKTSSLIPTKIIKITEKDSKATAAGKAVRNTFVGKPAEKGGAEEAAETRSTKRGARSRK